MMSTKPYIRSANETDQENILGLLNGVFSDNQRTSWLRDHSYWDWKFVNNPFGKSILSVAEVNNEIVGIDNLWPWELEVKGSVIKALQPCDAVVHKDYRGLGIFNELRRFGLNISRERDYKLFFNFPNKNSLPANISLGWHFQGTIPWRVKIMQPLKIIQGMLSHQKSYSVCMNPMYHLDIPLIDRIAQKYHDLDNYLNINRIPRFHEWRYQNHPHRSYGMVEYKKGNHQTVAIFTLNKKGGSTEMVIMDIIGAAENMLPLVKEVIQAGKQMNAGFIAIMDNPKYNTQELWKVGFFKKYYKNMVVMPTDNSLEGIVKGYSNWSMMAALHDSI